MYLNHKGLTDTQEWLNRGYKLPQFDIEQVTQDTKKAPTWIHFGAGNIFRAFPAKVVQHLLEQEVLTKGLIMCEGYDYEIIDQIDQKHHNLNILVTLKADGSVEKTVLASIVESLKLDPMIEDYKRLKEIFENPSLQMVSFTITEKGYSLKDQTGQYICDVAADIKTGPQTCQSYMGKVVSLLYHRYQNSHSPIAMVSLDNCSHNGDKLKDAVTTLAQEWVLHGFVDEGFVSYVNDPIHVSFPWTMIDKITPRPDSSVMTLLQADTLNDIEPIITAKNTYIAPFVNAEECEYLVIEDVFPNGRPTLEEGGLFFTDRSTVDQVEKMKVCTCLNPLHTALAVFGCLLGYDKISEEMKDPDLRVFIEQMAYTEGLPVVVNPGILDPKEFLDAVLRIRLPNPFMPDAPQRIATDTSQKLGIRFGETIKAYLASPNLHVSSLKLIPFVFAGWLRYLMAVDDAGQVMELSPDPRLDYLTKIMVQVPFGPFTKEQPLANEEIELLLRPILSDVSIFAVDLYEVGMAPLIIQYFMEMIQGAGAVKCALHNIVSKS